MKSEQPVLFGRFLSPYVRRVGVTLHLYGISFERQVISAIGDEETRERVNPIGRVPALRLGSGEVLIDSAAILDYLDELVGPSRSLMPAEGKPRRRALFRLALATGAIDRAMTANAERRRPAGQVDEERILRLLRQSKNGFHALEHDLGQKPWFNGVALGQPDVTTVAGFSFLNHIIPGTLPVRDFPMLTAMAARCENCDEFQAAAID